VPVTARRSRRGGHGAAFLSMSLRAYQPGAATSIEVSGQSGQSELHTVGELRSGGPATAELDDSDVRLACSYTALRPGPEQHGWGQAAAEPALRLGRMSSPRAEPQAARRRPGADSGGRTRTTGLAASLTWPRHSESPASTRACSLWAGTDWSDSEERDAGQSLAEADSECRSRRAIRVPGHD
jgi:hypothetical protein